MNLNLEKIAAADYNACFGSLQHIFLIGNLKRPCPHPFFRDPRIEMIVCEYRAGDNGLFHWHPAVTEYEYILEGSIAYQEADTGKTTTFHAGDLATVPPGVCVQRIVTEPARALAIKIPSNDAKTHCAQCTRDCPSRLEPYQEKS